MLKLSVRETSIVTMIVTVVTHYNSKGILAGVGFLTPVEAAIPAMEILTVTKMWTAVTHKFSNRTLVEAPFPPPVHPVWQESGAVTRMAGCVKHIMRWVGPQPHPCFFN